jgi:DsbC/DsbD-like thiol-disulfide interchange protein
MRKSFLCAGIVTSLLAVSTASFAETVAAVSAVAKPAKVARGGHGVLVLTLTVKPGYHVNAHTLKDASYIPTVVAPKAAPGITFGEPKYPKSETVQMQGVGPMQVYTGHVVISVPYTVTPAAKPGKASLGATVNYQGCNSQSCYPPTSADASAAITVK